MARVFNLISSYLTYRNKIQLFPKSLFDRGQKGVWYDPSDITTLYQDTTAITPVTAPGQSVGLMLDKSGNGFHATQAITASRPAYGIMPEGGRRNLLTRTEEFDNAAWGTTRGTVSATSDPQQWYFANDGVNQTSILSTAINPSGGAIFAIDIKADTIRYVRLRYLNVTNTDFVNIDAQTGASSGTAGVDVGDGFYRFVLPFVSGADNIGAINITLSDTLGGTTVTPSESKRIIIRRPQFELGSTTTPYQRVGTALDVTEAGKRSVGYLSFDGIGDFMQTPTITPGTDKVQVFAGVRKLSDAARRAIAELSASIASNDGAFALMAPNAASATFAFESKGTSLTDAVDTGIAAPATRVLTGLGDIVDDTTTLRINGTQEDQDTGDQGTGNYLAYPLYIGARAGTSLFFNGHLYSLIVSFGPNLGATQIGNIERYVASNTPGVSFVAPTIDGLPEIGVS
jgi:hypothetical protein